jgi:hypothetical protein
MLEADKITRRGALVAVAGLTGTLAATWARAAEPERGKTFVCCKSDRHGQSLFDDYWAHRAQ